MKPGKALLFVIAGIILISIDACSNPFLQKNGNEGRNIGPGSGLVGDPFLVRTVDDLLHVGNPEPDTKYAEWDLDKYYKQLADINLTSITNWTPIGTNVADLNNPFPFTGSYDGNGCKILGLKILDEEFQTYQGLFSYIDTTGEVKNLGIGDVDISGYFTVGGVAGSSYGTIQNCYVTGSISGNYEVGGVAGDNYGTIQNCYVTGSISGGSMVGGVTGGNFKDGGSMGVVQNCYTVCEISVEDSIYGGGVVGINSAIVQNCYAAGSISGKQYYLGGVVGFSTGIVWNCVALNSAVETEYPIFDNPDEIGRVVGVSSSSDTINNNYAWEGLIIQGVDIAKDLTYAGRDTVDGLRVGANNIKDKSWWTAQANWKTDEGAVAWDFTDTWIWDNTGIKMPSLKNCPALPWPTYLN